MSARRDARLSPADLALKLAFRDAVRAAGGQEFVAGEIGRTQSRVSDWCNANVDEFPPIDIVRRVEALGPRSGRMRAPCCCARSTICSRR